MSELTASDFTGFFQAVHGYEPFPWQRMLVERVLQRGWPEGIDLPTASGKTACIDVAVFVLALAAKGKRLLLDHPARRRIFFVVDRRIVVDEAYQRARRLADRLQQASEGIVRRVADKLRGLAGGETPLVASRLRGGTLRDDAWRLSPVQPSVITSTVDQTGSRLLFRSYGSSHLSSPIEAALTGCDSLILLDEAHCAVPFLQTARGVQRYMGPDWVEADGPLSAPMTFCILSATLPDEVQEIFPAPQEREAALGSAVLQQRIEAAKPAELVQARRPRQREWSLGEPVAEDDLVLAAAQRAADLVHSEQHKRIAVMVNRVATAGAIHSQLRQAAETAGLDADVVLMTGRMRPVDRDVLVDRWSPVLRAGAGEEPSRPVVLVTTQCLEVGADFSFDALVTECASLDALRQRFGRLNRLGEFGAVDAAVMVRRGDTKPDDKLDDSKPLDWIYGNALARAWNWLTAHADDDRFDFGISAVEAKLPADRGELATLLAPSPDAVVLLPAHVDLLCETAPQPTPGPDVSLFLHGPQRHRPEARVVFRADLTTPDRRGWQREWVDAVCLLPPLTAEALTVPLPVLRRWLTSQPATDELAEVGDVEGQRSRELKDEAARGQPFVIWRGLRDTVVSHSPNDIRPNETVVVRADDNLADALGYAFTRLPGAPLDAAEHAYQTARQQHVLRLLPAVLKTWAGVEPVAELLSWAQDEEHEAAMLPELLRRLAEHQDDPQGATPALPDWLREAAAALAKQPTQKKAHPSGGLILLGPTASDAGAESTLDFGDADDTLAATDQPVALDAHTQDVVGLAQTWAERCLPDPLAEALVAAAKLHDLGKADGRFQVLLHGDEAASAVAMEKGLLLAKSEGPRHLSSAIRRLREAIGLPEGFRHEMLSMQTAEVSVCLPHDRDLVELVLHLIASHHGHGRPFAPVAQDDELPGVEARVSDTTFRLTHEQREGLIPPHRLDSGVPERFWRLTRRYGWWGLAYLEAILRLADRRASAAEAAM